MERYLWLITLGFVVGGFGTLIGAGGGFVLVPVLLLLYPSEPPETITSITLAVVFFNALSGSAAYALMKRIDYRLGTIFSLATVPGAVLGAATTAYIPRRLFDLVFGVLMIAASAFLLFRPGTTKLPKVEIFNGLIGVTPTGDTLPRHFILGALLSIIVGFVSSLLGIGAGFIYVPALVYLLDFPVHTATATSQFILAITAFTGSATHVFSGLFHHGVRRTVALAIGVVLGAQLGARFSEHTQGDWIIRCLAIALAFVGIRIFVMAL
jgi:uncharacterized membrane protein YfcA